MLEWSVISSCRSAGRNRYWLLLKAQTNKSWPFRSPKEQKPCSIYPPSLRRRLLRLPQNPFVCDSVTRV